MDELEILKKDWKKNENAFDQISEKEIYGMLHKRSSSIVRWILIISLLELVLWSGISFATADDEYFKTLEVYHLETIMPILSLLNYAVILFFIYLFFKNYKTINTTDTVKQLMHSILKTRKTVKQYVWFNIGMTAFIFILVFIFQFMYDPNIQKLIEKMAENFSLNTFYLIMIVVYTLIILVFIGLISLFYRVLYGILMRKLQKNYEELEKINF